MNTVSLNKILYIFEVISNTLARNSSAAFVSLCTVVNSLRMVAGKILYVIKNLNFIKLQIKQKEFVRQEQYFNQTVLCIFAREFPMICFKFL